MNFSKYLSSKTNYTVGMYENGNNADAHSQFIAQRQCYLLSTVESKEMITMSLFTLSCNWLLKILFKGYEQITFLFLFDAVCINLYGSTSNKYLLLTIVEGE